MRAFFAALFVLFVLYLPASAQIKSTENTVKLAEGESGGKATLADMAWLAGSWMGEGLGGISEEMWSKPAGGAMMGTYRLIKDGKPVFYELLLITEENGSLAIKLKHFHADLRGWEERDASVRFPLVAKRDGRIYFDGMTFERIGADRYVGEFHFELPIGGNRG